MIGFAEDGGSAPSIKQSCKPENVNPDKQKGGLSFRGPPALPAARSPYLSGGTDLFPALDDAWPHQGANALPDKLLGLGFRDPWAALRATEVAVDGATCAPTSGRTTFGHQQRYGGKFA